MAKSKWTVSNETTKIDFSVFDEPVWIRVRNELSVGEQRGADTAGFGSMVSEPPKGEPGEGSAERRNAIDINWKGQSFARAEAYLTDWSLTDDDGNKLPLDRSTIEALKKPVYKAIDEQIGKHVEAMEKNAPGAKPKP